MKTALQRKIEIIKHLLEKYLAVWLSDENQVISVERLTREIFLDK